MSIWRGWELLFTFNLLEIRCQKWSFLYLSVVCPLKHSVWKSYLNLLNCTRNNKENGYNHSFLFAGQLTGAISKGCGGKRRCLLVFRIHRFQEGGNISICVCHLLCYLLDTPCVGTVAVPIRFLGSPVYVLQKLKEYIV